MQVERTGFSSVSADSSHRASLETVASALVREVADDVTDLLHGCEAALLRGSIAMSLYCYVAVLPCAHASS
eukprot:6176066-Pleurochrysis_carterae.AAC.3